MKTTKKKVKTGCKAGGDYAKEPGKLEFPG
jgi:hypothetical protein